MGEGRRDERAVVFQYPFYLLQGFLRLRHDMQRVGHDHHIKGLVRIGQAEHILHGEVQLGRAVIPLRLGDHLRGGVRRLDVCRCVYDMLCNQPRAGSKLQHRLVPHDWPDQRIHLLICRRVFAHEAVVTSGEQLWERELSRFTVEGPQRVKETFYTSAYRCFLSPFLFQDADGRFREHDKSIGRAEGFTNYTTFSFWDTYRAFHPLMNLVRADMSADVANSMLAHYDKSVERMLPVWSFYGNETWCMIGYHAVSVLADMIVKQVPGFDYERAFEAMKRTATNPNYDCLPEYTKLGWVPFDKERESVSKTLEYAYDDYCIAQAARALGKEEDYDYFLRRSLSYRNLIDPETKFMRGRDSQGRWRTPFTPVAYQGPGSVHGWGDITEGFTLQYTWYVPHDVAGHIDRVGRRLYETRLDSLFVTELPDDIPGAHDIQGRIGAYWHGNEPCHNIVYLYNYLGQPWKCQQWVRRISDAFYGNEPGSLSGNDDCGQMSAWYLFNTMGFYPTAPSSNVYNIGSPTVEGVELRLSNGKSIRVTTENWSPENVYIRRMYVDGRVWDKSYITYDDIRDGVHLHYVMGSRPDKRRAVSAAAVPPSLPVATRPDR